MTTVIPIDETSDTLKAVLDWRKKSRLCGDYVLLALEQAYPDLSLAASHSIEPFLHGRQERSTYLIKEQRRLFYILPLPGRLLVRLRERHTIQPVQDPIYVYDPSLTAVVERCCEELNAHARKNFIVRTLF